MHTVLQSIKMHFDAKSSTCNEHAHTYITWKRIACLWCRRHHLLGLCCHAHTHTFIIYLQHSCKLIAKLLMVFILSWCGREMNALACGHHIPCVNEGTLLEFPFHFVLSSQGLTILRRDATYFYYHIQNAFLTLFLDKMRDSVLNYLRECDCWRTHIRRHARIRAPTNAADHTDRANRTERPTQKRK